MNTIIDKQYTWWLVTTFKTGHRLWFDRQSRRYSIADLSGDISFRYGRPNNTDDGVLWLDPKRPIKLPTEYPIRTMRDVEGLTLSIPAIDPDGTSFSFLASGVELKWLVRNFNWPLETGSSIWQMGTIIPRVRRQPEPLNFCRKHIIKET